MRITDFLVADAINVDLKSQNKKDVLGELLQPLAKAGKIADAKKMVDVLLESARSWAPPASAAASPSPTARPPR